MKNKRQVAYHAGPPTLHHAGRHWQLGVSQAMTEKEFQALQARETTQLFDFREEPAAPTPRKSTSREK